MLVLVMLDIILCFLSLLHDSFFLFDSFISCFSFSLYCTRTLTFPSLECPLSLTPRPSLLSYYAYDWLWFFGPAASRV